MLCRTIESTPMTWTPLSEADLHMAHGVTLWIETARKAGYGGPDWLPSRADFVKSALFERIRSGKAPLPYPPPVGFACPWYALVEDVGPHPVGEAHTPFVPVFGQALPEDGEDAAPRESWDLQPGEVTVLMNRYRIVETRGEQDFMVVDAHHVPQTPYRFRLWLDREWRHPSRPEGYPRGGWFIQNMEFADQSGDIPVDQDNDPDAAVAPLAVPEVVQPDQVAATAEGGDPAASIDTIGRSIPHNCATEVAYDRDGDTLSITLDNGTVLRFPRRDIPAFKDMTPERMTEVRISPRGWGIVLEAEFIHLNLDSMFERAFLANQDAGDQ